jgi:hypothetical protein
MAASMSDRAGSVAVSPGHDPFSKVTPNAIVLVPGLGVEGDAHVHV